MSDIGGLAEAKQKVEDLIVGPLKNPELAKKYGKRIGGGIVLYGPPGCGKTQLAKAIASECSASFFNVRISDVLSMWHGQSERNLRQIFSTAKQHAPSLVFIDEIDALGFRREDSVGDIGRKVLSQLLTELDATSSDDRVFVLAATNAPWDVDPALLRPGRFDEKILVPPPNKAARAEIFKIHSSTLRAHDMLANDVSFDRLAELSQGLSGADIKDVVTKAANRPWQSAYKGSEHRKVSMTDLLDALKKRKSSVESWLTIAKLHVGTKATDEFSSEMARIIEKGLQEEVGGYM